MDEDEDKSSRGSKRDCKGPCRTVCGKTGKHGFVYGEDTVWQREFEEMFPFEETEDQLLAIEATKKIWRAPRSWIA